MADLQKLPEIGVSGGQKPLGIRKGKLQKHTAQIVFKQQDIAELLGTTQQTYSLWERGEREIPFHHVITLANYYQVSLDYIAELTDNKKIKSSQKPQSP